MADASVYSSELETKRKRNGKFCAVAECTGRHSDGISVHSFPAKDQKQRQQWIDFVRTCRADFEPRFSTPNNNSYICERHFPPDSYPVTYGLCAEFHIPLKNKRLNPGAVPTIQKHAFSHQSQRKTASRPTSAVTSTVTMVSVTGCCTMTTTAHSYPCVTPIPGVSTVRSAFAKRERKRSAWAASNWITLKTCAGGSASSVQLPGCPKIITRAEWGARPASTSIGQMPDLPIYVFIHHGGAGSECFNTASCSQIVRGYQNYHMDTHVWSDIGYSFVVGEDGNAYEARGWTEIGAHTQGYNTNGIGICIIGDFTSKVPNSAALNTVKQLIQCGLDNNKISHSYTLKGHRDVGQTDCPGTQFYNLIQSWPRYASGTRLFG